MKIACVGEAMIELSVDPSGRNAAVGYAGDTLNTAIYLKRNLQAAGDVYFTSVLGQDQFSDWMLHYIGNEDINTSTILRHKTLLPGIYSISKNTRSFWITAIIPNQPAQWPDYYHGCRKGEKLLYVTEQEIEQLNKSLSMVICLALLFT